MNEKIEDKEGENNKEELQWLMNMRTSILLQILVL